MCRSDTFTKVKNSNWEKKNEKMEDKYVHLAPQKKKEIKRK